MLVKIEEKPILEVRDGVLVFIGRAKADVDDALRKMRNVRLREHIKQ
jgi:hypothetical protein